MKCGTFAGKKGFYSVGGAQMLCSDCHAEFGCERCCPLMLSSTAPTTGPSVPSIKEEQNAQTHLVILCTVLGIAALVSLAVVLNCAWKRWKKSRRMPDCGRPRDFQNDVEIPMTSETESKPSVSPEEQEGYIGVGMPEEEQEMSLARSSSVTCIPTQETDEKNGHKDLVPEGRPLFEKDIEGEEEEL
eukprot:Seg4218.2 transcript_id=Seg4218.2/GoldUCD/mRNA.D3Y31 product="hypothetical protein" protein_id=Seg4218.2/GoldUCD/D3Y31